MHLTTIGKQRNGRKTCQIHLNFLKYSFQFVKDEFINWNCFLSLLIYEINLQTESVHFSSEDQPCLCLLCILTKNEMLYVPNTASQVIVKLECKQKHVL